MGEGVVKNMTFSRYIIYGWHQRTFTKMINNMKGKTKKDYTVCSYVHLKIEGTDRISLKCLRCVMVCQD